MQKLLGQSLCLLAEDYVGVVGVSYIRMNMLSLGRKIEKFSARVFLKKVREVLIICYVKQMSVVESGSF